MTEFERFLRQLPDQDAERGRQVFRRRRVDRGELVVRVGDPPDRVAFVEQGLFRLYGTDDAGTERTLAFRAEGELVCAYSAALRREPSRIAIEALEPSWLMVAQRPEYDAMVAANPGWQQLVGRLTEALYLALERRQSDLLLTDAADRYTRFVTEHPALAARLTQRQIASYVGVTPEALSRIRRRLISINDGATAPAYRAGHDDNARNGDRGSRA
ncbi:Crp/Fnr family transcriptional regulator [Kribbella sp. NPDC026611]|uniref:Crp/Fnr family transcriptional regulator n=1 Tax=Kribbella sp. NPDC026611 TaxID=3154911 RepID=UPI0033EBE197